MPERSAPSASRVALPARPASLSSQAAGKTGAKVTKLGNKSSFIFR